MLPPFSRFSATMASSPSKPPGRASFDASADSNHFRISNESNGGFQSIENASESNNHGLKRASREISTLQMLEELPEEVFMQVLSDLLREDRLSVAITCKDLLKKVEVFCQRKWKEIGANADETWETRLRDTSLINANVPPELLPHRYLLSKAYQTPLFTLGDPGEDFRSIKVSKDGNHLMRASFSESGGLFKCGT